MARHSRMASLSSAMFWSSGEMRNRGVGSCLEAASEAGRVVCL